MTIPSLKKFGPIGPQNLYVKRMADVELYASVQQGEFCYIAGPRQNGKTSLVHRLLRDLGGQNEIRAVKLDLSGRNYEDLPILFVSLASEISIALDLQSNPRSWWEAQQDTDALGLWFRWLEEEVINVVAEKVLIIIDEADALISRDEVGPRFLERIRRVYIDRSQKEKEHLNRLTFAVLGVFPNALSHGTALRTPFNIGKIIVVDDFSREECSAFLPHLFQLQQGQGASPEDILDEIWHWTNGHPALTQCLMHEICVIRKTPIIRARREIDHLVGTVIFNNDPGLVFSTAEKRMREAEPGVSPAEKYAYYQQLLAQYHLDPRPDNAAEIAVRMAGLAARRIERGVPKIALRNTIFEKHFDETWVQEKIAAIKKSPPAAAAPAVRRDDEDQQGLEDVKKIMTSLPEMGQTIVTGPGEVLIPRLLYRIPVHSERHGRAALQVFRQVGTSAAGLMWEQEMRALTRLSSSLHSSLPRILQGKYVEDQELAFSLTTAHPHTLAETGAFEFFRDKPAMTFREICRLVDALNHLHNNGMVHGNIAPEAIEVSEELASNDKRLHLARFEMSSLISNVLRYVEGDNVSNLEAVRHLLKRHSSKRLIYNAPERLAYFLGEGDVFLSSRTDMYSIGILAYEIFIEPLPEDDLAPVFPRDLHGASAYVPEALAGLLDRMREKVSEAGHLPPDFKDVLKNILQFEWMIRHDSAKARADLGECYDRVLNSWRDDKANPCLIVFQAKRIERSMRALTSVTRPDRMRAFIDEDLNRGRRLSFSKWSCARLTQSTDPVLSEARYVLVGANYLYFAVKHIHRNPWASTATQVYPEALEIVAVFSRNGRAESFHSSSRSRQLPTFKVEVLEAQSVPDLLKIHPYPDWTPLLASVEQDRIPDDLADQLDAMEWLIDLDEARIKLRQYPVRVQLCEGNPGDRHLVLDEEMWSDAKSGHPLMAVLARQPRFAPSLAQFFEENTEVCGLSLQFRTGKPGAPGMQVKGCRFVARVDATRIEVHFPQAKSAPKSGAIGWVSFDADRGSASMCYRQRTALAKASDNPRILDQLRSPEDRVEIYIPWTLPSRGESLTGGAAEVVKAMMSFWPFFALHGPPGTGKTTVTAMAVADQLKYDHGMRVMVSAQSHFALDNLGVRVLREVGVKDSGAGAHPDYSVVRLCPRDAEDRVAPEMQRFFPDKQVEEILQRIERRCRDRLAEVNTTQAERQIYQDWLGCCRSSRGEIIDNLVNGANIVFITTGACTDNYLAPNASPMQFDLIVVEEAAKAWLTELIMPLMYGQRWALVGDHKQLPAFNKDTIISVLAECARSDHKYLKAIGEKSKALDGVLNFFERLFVDREGRERDLPPSVPLRKLTTQFRMAEPIADVVSKVFYNGEVKTGGMVSDRDPPFLLPALPNIETTDSLIWLDTTGFANRYEAPRKLVNQMEVTVAQKLCGALLQVLPSEFGSDQVAILSPYRDQNEVLKQHLDSRFRDCIKTVDSFQGREAELVILSLVRSSDNKTHGGYGFLRDEQRLNVMMSRARQWLFIIGDFSHFDAIDAGDNPWRKICPALQQYRQDVRRVFPELCARAAS